MSSLPIQAVWVWILLGLGVAVPAWWAILTPGMSQRRLFGPALGAVLILLLVVVLRGVALGESVLPF